VSCVVSDVCAYFVADCFEFFDGMREKEQAAAEGDDAWFSGADNIG
jgi:hypothetical protein